MLMMYYHMHTHTHRSTEDFATAMGFVKEATSVIVTERPTAQVGVLQFSNDVKEEIAVGAVEDMAAFEEAVEAVVWHAS